MPPKAQPQGAPPKAQPQGAPPKPQPARAPPRAQPQGAPSAQKPQPQGAPSAQKAQPQGAPPKPAQGAPSAQKAQPQGAPPKPAQGAPPKAPPSEQLLDILRKYKLRILTVESMTGGALINALTNVVSNTSLYSMDIIYGSYVVYSPDAKYNMLGLKDIDEKNIDSAYPTRRMIEITEDITGADVIIAISGYAGRPRRLGGKVFPDESTDIGSCRYWYSIQVGNYIYSNYYQCPSHIDAIYMPDRIRDKDNIVSHVLTQAICLLNKIMNEILDKKDNELKRISIGLRGGCDENIEPRLEESEE